MTNRVRPKRWSVIKRKPHPGKPKRNHGRTVESRLPRGRKKRKVRSSSGSKKKKAKKSAGSEKKEELSAAGANNTLEKKELDKKEAGTWRANP